MTKAEREIRAIAEGEGLSHVRMEQLKRSSHHWLIGDLDGQEIRTIVAVTKGGDPRFNVKCRGNIRQAIRRAEQERRIG